MGIIQKDLTLKDKQVKTRTHLNVHLTAGASQLYLRSQQVWVHFWNNPEGLSCQEVFDSFGTDAFAMAKLLGQCKALIDSIDPTLWKLERPGTVVPVMENGIPTGHVIVTLNP